MGNKPKFYVGNIEERNGDYTYKITVRYKTAACPKRYLKNIAAKQYDGDRDEDVAADGYYFHCGSVFVKPGSCKEITQEVFDQLSEVIPAV